MRRAAAGAVAVMVLMVASAAGALPADRQSVRTALTTERPGASTGSQMKMRFADPANPDGKPYSVDRVVVESPHGTRFDDTAVPQCRASDAELMALGKAACPPGSRVQHGRLSLDTGSPLLVPRLIRFRTATFNTEGGLVSLGEAKNFPFRGVIRSQIHRNVVSVDYADAPGWGGPDSQSAMKTMFTTGPALAPRGRPYIRTSRRCPRSGRWTTHFTFIYHDGVRQIETTHDPCRAL